MEEKLPCFQVIWDQNENKKIDMQKGLHVYQLKVKDLKFNICILQ